MTVNAHLGLECDECGAQVVPGLWKVGDDCRHCPGHIRVPPSSASGPPEPPTLMSEEARAEIEEFRGHLIEHVGTTAAGCRFCAARDASLRAARSASGEDSSNV